MIDVVVGRPQALLLLWLLPPIGLLWWYRLRRCQRAALRFASATMGKRLMPAADATRSWIRGGLVLVALALVIVAAARPRWGVYFEQVHQRGADVMILLDVSRSMLSEDVAPNRLERARSDIRDFLREVGGDRVGLIAFAGKASVACPPTVDHGFFRMILDSVGPDSAPRGGTAIGDAIREALRAMEEAPDRDQALLLITDGEDHDSFPLEAAAAAAERGVKIFTVGLGDPAEGARIPVQAAGTYLKHQGQEVWSRMDERLLRELALKTGGAYVPARTSVYDLGQVYEDHLSQLEAGEIDAEKRKRYRERFQVFVAGAVALLLAEVLIRPYPRRAALAAALLLLAAPAGFAAGPADVEDKVAEGVRLLRAGDLEGAARCFDDADVSRPDDPIIAFDRALVRHARGEADEAETLYLDAARTRDLSLSADSHFNLGSVAVERARAVLGETPAEADPEAREEALAHLDSAIGRFRYCLELQPDREDARHNLELLRLWVKHMSDEWARRDREREREEMGLLEFLERMVQRQDELRLVLRRLAEEDDSPRRRVGLVRLGDEQGTLREDIAPLQDKIRKMFEEMQAPGAGPAGAAPPAPAPAPDPEQAKAAEEALLGATDKAAEAMDRARADLEGSLLEEAESGQREAFAALFQAWVGLAPLGPVIQAALGTQELVVERTRPHVAAPEPPEAEGGEAPAEEPDAAGDPEGSAEPPMPIADNPDYELLPEFQERIGLLAQVLPLKVEQQLQQMEGMQQAPPPANAPPPSEEDAESLAAFEDQLESLRRARAVADENAPEVVDLSRAIAGDLRAEDPDAALPREERALELLREIAEQLPKNQGEGQDSPEDSEGDPSENEDSQSQEDQGESDDDSPQPQEEGSRESRPMSREEAEALLRRASERERDHREKRRELLQAAGGRARVERDW